MSGLCALVTFDGSVADENAVVAMTGAAPHRGRDGTSIWVGAGAALAQQTLIVTEWDLPGPPVRAGGLVVAADCRLDNRQDLIPILVRNGHLPQAERARDAEVITAAYRSWGCAAPGMIIGDFAFVVFDERCRRVFAARDPLGMRALYYRCEPGRRVLLATEIKQLLKAPGVACTIDELGVAATLAGPYLPPDRTLYEGIAQVPPGHVLTVDADGSGVRRYWAPDPATLDVSSEEDAAALYRQGLERAVATRLEVTRPVGIFLSGGTDSGSVAATAGLLRESGRARPPGLRTYSWAFAELTACDERATSSLIGERYGLADTAVPADDWWPLAGYPAHGPDRDDPYCWVYQALIEHTLEHCVADGVGLVISGDRGDELTGDWIYDELGLLRAGRFASAIRDMRLAARDGGLSMPVTVRRLLVRPAVETILGRPLERREPLATPGLPWVTPELARRTDLADVIAEHVRPTPFGGPARTARAQRIFSPQGARIAVLRERTRARYGMAFADPFADRRLIELVLSLPQWTVQRRGQSKALARSAMVGVVPETARQAMTKTIPHALFDRGFRERALPVVTELLDGSIAAEQGWLDVQRVRDEIERHARTGDAHHDFWWPLCVELWLRRWWSDP